MPKPFRKQSEKFTLVSKVYSADGYQYLLWYGCNYYYEIEVRNQKQQTLDTIKITDASSKQALKVFEDVSGISPESKFK